MPPYVGSFRGALNELEDSRSTVVARSDRQPTNAKVQYYLIRKEIQ
jgi:hypothetical protein